MHAVFTLKLRHNFALCALILATSLSGCDQNSSSPKTPPSPNAQAPVQTYEGLSKTNPIKVDQQAGVVTMLAKANSKYFKEESRHGIVFEGGSNGNKAVFTGLANPKEFYEALVQIGAKAGENMTFENKETTHVTGDKLDIHFKWAGSQKYYDIDEMIKDSNGNKFDIRFGGNLSVAENVKTGCLLCLDSCPVGIVSNAVYTYGAVEKRGEVKFIGNSAVQPPDDALVAVTLKVIK